MLCSTGRTTEDVLTFRDGLVIGNEHHAHNVDAHCKILFSYRLRELVEEILVAIRRKRPVRISLGYRSNAFAAAVILHHELEYFKSSLRNGFKQTGDYHLPLSRITVLTSMSKSTTNEAMKTQISSARDVL